MALGADGSWVRGMVLRQVGRMAVVGGVIGVAAAVGVGQAAKSLLYGSRVMTRSPFPPPGWC